MWSGEILVVLTLSISPYKWVSWDFVLKAIITDYTLPSVQEKKGSRFMTSFSHHLDSFCFVVQNALIMYGWTNIKWCVNSEPESVRFISSVGKNIVFQCNNVHNKCFSKSIMSTIGSASIAKFVISCFCGVASEPSITYILWHLDIEGAATAPQKHKPGLAPPRSKALH